MDFPKYTTQLINLACQNAKGNSKRVVGDMKELMAAFPGHTLEEWAAWHARWYPAAVNQATFRICDALNKLKEALDHIDQAMVQAWVEDLVYQKTFEALYQPPADLELAKLTQDRQLPDRE